MKNKSKIDTRTKIAIVVALPLIVLFWILTAAIVLFYPYCNLISWIANGYGISFRTYHELFSPMRL